MSVFFEMGKVEITSTKGIVISRRNDGLYSLAQVGTMVGEDGKETSVYFKGAFTLSSDGLLKIKNLIDDIFDEEGNEK